MSLERNVSDLPAMVPPEVVDDEENRSGRPRDDVIAPPSASFTKLEMEFKRFPSDVVVSVGLDVGADPAGGSELVVASVPLVRLSLLAVEVETGMEVSVDSPELLLLLS